MIIARPARLRQHVADERRARRAPRQPVEVRGLDADREDAEPHAALAGDETCSRGLPGMRHSRVEIAREIRGVVPV